MKRIKGYMLILGAIVVLAGCNTSKIADTAEQPEALLARIVSEEGSIDIPLEPYAPYLRVLGELSVSDAREELVAIAAMIYDLKDTDYRPDWEMFYSQAETHMQESILSDAGYAERLKLVAEAMNITMDEQVELLSLDLLGQYLSSRMFDKMWSELPEELYEDDTLTEEQQENMRYDDCLAQLYTYLDDLADRVAATENPAVYLVSGESVEIAGQMGLYLEYCRYITQIERVYDIVSITAFVKEMQRLGATFDEQAIHEEAKSLVLQTYDYDPATSDWIEQASASIGISRGDFDESYAAVQALNIRFGQCDATFAQHYENRPEDKMQLSESDFYAELMERLMEGSEILSIIAIPPDNN